MTTNKILLLDIETSFKIAGVWGRYDQNIAMNQIIQDTHILTWSAKWLGAKGRPISFSLYDFPSQYKSDPTNDRMILKALSALLDEADYVIGHNLDKFDIPYINARLFSNDLPPPSPFTTIDTLKISRRRFKNGLSSHRLNDLGTLLGVGQKMDTGGFGLWKDVVLKKDLRAFKKMSRYCEQDVLLLEKIYLKLRPWNNNTRTTPKHTTPDGSKCLACGSKHIKKNGFYTTASGAKVNKYRCTECGFNMKQNKKTVGVV